MFYNFPKIYLKLFWTQYVSQDSHGIKECG